MDDLKFRNGLKHRSFVEGNPKYGILVRPLQFLSEFEIIKRAKLVRNEIIENQINKKTNINTEIISGSKCKSIAEKSENVLNKLIEISRKDNVQLVISWTVDPLNDNKCLSYGSYNWLKNWAINNNVKFADYVPMLNSTKKNWVNMPYLHDHSGGHFRNWVNLIIAKSFIKHLK